MQLLWVDFFCIFFWNGRKFHNVRSHVRTEFNICNDIVFICFFFHVSLDIWFIDFLSWIKYFADSFRMKWNLLEFKRLQFDFQFLFVSSKLLWTELDDDHDQFGSSFLGDCPRLKWLFVFPRWNPEKFFLNASNFHDSAQCTEMYSFILLIFHQNE